MTGQRILTAAILIPIVVAADLYGPTWLIAILVALITALALREFFSLGVQAHLRGHVRWTISCALLLSASQYLAATIPPAVLVDSLRKTFVMATIPPRLPDLVVVIYILGVAVLTFAGETPLAESFKEMGISSAGFLLIAFPVSFLIRLHGVNKSGPRLLLFVLLLVWVGDTAAYFVGRYFGRHAMAPRLSPKKTWEGAAANLIGSLIVATLIARWIGVELPQALIMGALGNVAGQLGDLTESAYKRGAGAKDSSSLLPGHGGILDRIDSLILAAPVVWYYFSVVVFMYD